MIHLQSKVSQVLPLAFLLSFAQIVSQSTGAPVLSTDSHACDPIHRHDANNRTCCDNNFTCIYDNLWSELIASKHFSDFSHSFLLNEQGKPTFVYIGISVAWDVCSYNDSSAAVDHQGVDNITDALFVWGRFPTGALFGPVQEAFYFGTFDPLILVGPLMVTHILQNTDYYDVFEEKRDTFQPWLSVDYPKLTVSMEKACFSSKYGIHGRPHREINKVLLELLKKSEQLASGNHDEISFQKGHVVQFEVANALTKITIALHILFMLLSASALMRVSFLIYSNGSGTKNIEKINSFFKNLSMPEIKEISKAVNPLPYYYASGILLICHSIVSIIILGASFRYYRLANDKYENEFGYMRHFSGVLFYLQLIVMVMALFLSFNCGTFCIVFSIISDKKVDNKTEKKRFKRRARRCMYIGNCICLWIIIQQIIPLTIHAIIAPLITLALFIQYLCTLAITLAGVVTLTLLVNYCYSKCKTIKQIKTKEKNKKPATETVKNPEVVMSETSVTCTNVEVLAIKEEIKKVTKATINGIKEVSMSYKPETIKEATMETVKEGIKDAMEKSFKEKIKEAIKEEIKQNKINDTDINPTEEQTNADDKQELLNSDNSSEEVKTKEVVEKMGSKNVTEAIKAAVEKEISKEMAGESSLEEGSIKEEISKWEVMIKEAIKEAFEEVADKVIKEEVEKAIKKAIEEAIEESIISKEASAKKAVKSEHYNTIILANLFVILILCLGVVTCFTLLSGIGIILGITRIAITGMLGSLLTAAMGAITVKFINKALNSTSELAGCRQ